MRIDILTLFPETLGDVLSESIRGRAQERGFIQIHSHQIRDYTANKQNQVDDYPYGGGRGAVMTADPLYRCWEAVCDEAGGPVHTIYMSPCGHTFNQADAIRLSKLSNIVIVCGHYEGIDQRFIDECVDEEISLGDFVLTGGEIAAWLSQMPSAGWFPAFWQTRSALRMKATLPVFWNTPSTPVPPSGMAGKSPKFSSPATTKRFASGAESSPCAELRHVARICTRN